MRRIFGTKKPPPKGVTLEEASQRLDARGDTLDEKIKKLDAQLIPLREQIRRARPGPAQEAAKRRALQVLKQKKKYEGQRDQLYNQQANMESTTFALQSVKDTADTVSAMRAAGTELKAAMKDKNLDVSSIEKLQDEMADLMDAQTEIQEVMGQTFGVPDELDEDELLGELDALEDELAAEAAGGSTVDAGGAPSYLTEEPTDLPAVPAGRVPVAEPAGRN